MIEKNSEKTLGGSFKQKKKSIIIIVVVIAVVIIGVVLLLGRAKTNSSTQATKNTTTVQVTRQDLIDRKVVPGTLGFGENRALTASIGGTVTWTAEVAAVVNRDGALWRVDQKPTLLLYGPVPAYRSMRKGDTGADVRQLNENLNKLGYDGFTVNDTYSSGTVTAVNSWQEKHTLAKTGVVELGEVVFQPTSIRVASVNAMTGTRVVPGAPVLTITSTERVVSINLPTGDQALAKKGAVVIVTLPDDTKVNGKISSVGTVVSGSSQGGAPAANSGTIPVTVNLDDPAAGNKWDSAPVDVAMESGKVTAVLTVPVTALLSLSGGGYGVEVVEGGVPHLVGVTTGMFADSRVEVSGEGVNEGTSIEIPVP